MREPATSADSKAPAANTAGTPPWLVGPLFDALCIAWAWVPFYLFVVFGLGLDGVVSQARDPAPELGLAILTALGISYVHRHYTFLLVYGDGETLAQHRRAYLILPPILLAALALVLTLQGQVRLELLGLKLRPWMLVLIVTGAWNMWHTIMQRHGLARIYAGRAGGGLQERTHARRDLALVWSAAALTAVLTLMFRAETFAAVGNARRALQAAEPILAGPVPWILLLVVASVFLQIAYGWVVHEHAAAVTPARRVPRLNFWASTFALLAVFLVHGPIIGYLCFGVAHAVEYVFFFHVFGRKKFAGRPPERLGVAGKVLARPLLWGPLIALILIGAFLLLKDQRRSEPYLIYYTATSLLHFLYDGWIWKVRKPEVARVVLGD
ncbi:MAG: hypothetical protein KC457_04220 [Myxococcales bacterium]|nr:hypothetical protein [Myxococcales bacterium]